MTTHQTAKSTRHVLEALGLKRAQRHAHEFRAALCGVATLDGETSSTEPELLEILYCIVRHLRPHTVVEIGTYIGTSGAVLAAAMKENMWGRLYTVDNDAAGGLGRARKRFDEMGLAPWVTILEKRSEDAFGEWGRAKIDLLYIDGGHSFVQACIDLALWPRYIAADGLIVVHDTVTRLLRRFPEDYIYPLEHYDIVNVVDLEKRPSGHEWEGCAFIRPRVTRNRG